MSDSRPVIFFPSNMCNLFSLLCYHLLMCNIPVGGGILDPLGLFPSFVFVILLLKRVFGEVSAECKSPCAIYSWTAVAEVYKKGGWVDRRQGGKSCRLVKQPETVAVAAVLTGLQTKSGISSRACWVKNRSPNVHIFMHAPRA